MTKENPILMNIDQLLRSEDWVSFGQIMERVQEDQLIVIRGKEDFSSGKITYKGFYSADRGMRGQWPVVIGQTHPEIALVDSDVAENFRGSMYFPTGHLHVIGQKLEEQIIQDEGEEPKIIPADIDLNTYVPKNHDAGKLSDLAKLGLHTYAVWDHKLNLYKGTFEIGDSHWLNEIVEDEEYSDELTEEAKRIKCQEYTPYIQGTVWLEPYVLNQ